ncbi:hypothetical protein BO94DRAFT_592509 [Aspergillus sclerotioniger CBS 115572]|uniref:Uncharacterized protein n=1 Tax=Aspergillus sclerotioniger CBS 115572 TaxID=1450535 RepID=A0A317XDC7_9EURO|nr:hypothetical protein BO94DRAFT_592509 [Aspergillus sclerotioniger CBS 115572]PWY96626.1 hypothetical protein BO94DRAFT_592509 [Aspergillus sclerotioniger CBS 115572]
MLLSPDETMVLDDTIPPEDIGPLKTPPNHPTMIDDIMIEITASSTASLPHLTGPVDYELWCEALAADLRSIGYWPIISDPRPITTDPILDEPRYPPPPGTPQLELKLPQFELSLPLRFSPSYRCPRPPHNSLNDRARIMILETLSPQILAEVEHMSSAKDIWTYLDRKYYIVNPLDGIKAAMALRYDNGKSVLSYALKMQHALRKIDRAIAPGDQRVPEAMKVQFLLSGLGDEWREWLEENGREKEKEFMGMGLKEAVRVLGEKEGRSSWNWDFIKGWFD